MDVWPNKDPNEVLDYEFDWSNRLQDSETISSSDWTRESGTVVLGAEEVDGEITRVWLSGGTLGERNVLTNRIVTNMGRTYDWSAVLRVRAH